MCVFFFYDQSTPELFPPSLPDSLPISAADHEYRAVQASGHWLAGKTVLTQAVTELGAGFWVLTPLQMDDGNQVLVNRGDRKSKRLNSSHLVISDAVFCLKKKQRRPHET